MSNPTEKQYRETAYALFDGDDCTIDDDAMVAICEEGDGAWVACMRFVPRDEVEKPLTVFDGFEVRHDALGYYVCTEDEAEHEDEGNASVGFDGRDHYATIEEASEAMQAQASE